MKEGDGGILDGELVSLREPVVQGEDVASDDKGGADECRSHVLEARGGVGERDVFKREFD